MAHRSGILNVTANECTALADTSKSVPERRREFARLITHREHGDANVLFDAPGFRIRATRMPTSSWLGRC